MRMMRIAAATLFAVSLAPLCAATAAASPPPPTINQNGVNIHAQSKDLNDPHEVIGRAEKGDTLEAMFTCMVPVHGGDYWIHSNIHTHHGLVPGVVRSDLISGLDIGRLHICTPPAPTG